MVIDCVSSLKRGDEAIDNGKFYFKRLLNFNKYRYDTNHSEIITNDDSGYDGQNSYNDGSIVLSYTAKTYYPHVIEYSVLKTEDDTKSIISSNTICDSEEIRRIGIGPCFKIISDSAFTNNNNIEYIQICGDSLSTIGDRAFYRNGIGTTETTIHFNKEGFITTIGSEAFSNIKGLLINKNNTLYNGIDLSDAIALQNISQGAFAASTPPLGFSQYVINLSGCTSLTAINENTFAAMNGGYLCNVQCGKYDGFAIILPSSITTIDATAFLNTYIDNLTLLSNSPVTINGGIPQNWHIKILHVKSSLESHYNSIKSQWGVSNVIGDA